MHSLFTVAGLLALVALAFGERASVMVARAIVIVGLTAVIWLGLLIVFERL